MEEKSELELLVDAHKVLLIVEAMKCATQVAIANAGAPVSQGSYVMEAALLLHEVFAKAKSLASK